MVPAYLEELAAHPDDGRATRPTTRSCRRRRGRASPSAAAATSSRRAPRRRRSWRVRWPRCCKVERVSVEDNFFKELGAHSLLMARFCAKIRQHPALSDVSMRDIYLNPTIAQARRPSRCDGRSDNVCRDEAASRSASRPISNTTAAAPCSCCSMPHTRCSACGSSTPGSNGPMRRSTVRSSSTCAAWRLRVGRVCRC